MEKVHSSILGAIGNTPLIRLDQFTKNRGLEGTILAKLDHLNPGFSKKDRAALGAIEHAEKSGALAPGQTVIELTSGNMGTGLAIVCAQKGYPFIAVMSSGNSPERADMMRALGAEVVLVPQMAGAKPGEVSGEDLQLVEEEAQRLTETHTGFRVDQFNREGAWLAHYETTGPEIWDQCDGKIDGFCDFLGTGGTYAGVIKFLKERNPDIKGYVVEPEGAAAISGASITQPSHPIQGGGYAIAEPTFLNQTPTDGLLSVTGQEARDAARALACEEGVFGGFSTGANLAAAARLLEGEMKGKTLAILVCDSGLKYLSTDLYS